MEIAQIQTFLCVVCRLCVISLSPFRIVYSELTMSPHVIDIVLKDFAKIAVGKFEILVYWKTLTFNDMSR